MSGNSAYLQGLGKNQANFAPLTPLTFLERAAYVYPHRPSVVHGTERYTWQQTYARCRRLASALARRGIGKNDTVAIMAPNTPPMYEAHFGVPMCGAVLNALNTRLDAETVAFMLKHGGARVLIADREYSPVIEKALELLHRKPLVIDIDDQACPDGKLLGETTYEAFLSEGDPGYAWKSPADEWDAIALNYTSGTTGDPKGVVYHHRGAHQNAISNVLNWGMPHHAVYLWTLPMFHCNGWCFPWTMAERAGVSVCLRRVEAKAAWDAIRAEGVTHMCGAPIVYSMLINAPAELRAGIAHRIAGQVAGAAPPAAIIEGAERIGIELTHVYGLTEVYGPASICAKHEAWSQMPIDRRAERNGRQGVRVPLQDAMTVLDPATMQPVPWDGETMGEIMFRGNITMKGYLKNAAATEQAFGGGWFHTGDLAVMQADGYVKIRDRSKDIIISGGENISSLEVEEALYRHPAVLSAAVVAQPDEKWGETPCAFIELKPGASVTAEALAAFCREHLARFKVPKTFIFRELPKTSTGKIQKFALREIARSASAIEWSASGYRRRVREEPAMTDYAAPVRDMRFVLTELIGLDRVAALPGCEAVTPDLVDAILDEAARFAEEVVAPLNKPGDAAGAVLVGDAVRTAPGFRDAYAQFVAGGWNALGGDPEYGGQGLPMMLSTAVKEMWNAANMAFALCPLLTSGAIEALHLVGTDDQKTRFLPNMIEGTWTGTMNLTEPQAGSDLAAVRTRAEPEGEHYRIRGQKIFITYGEHDFTENIVHLVLARLPDAPEGVKGISLFVVPKFLVNPDGSLGRRNDVRCIALEHKLGIHASPTAAMSYGDAEGAIGYLIGEANRGLEYMFIMMNRARFDVGLQGVAIGDRAFQQALDYARNRVQGSEAGVRGGGRVPIVRHPDVRRMLLRMKSQAEASRALAYTVAAWSDIAERHPEEQERARHQSLVDLLIPVVKGWSTEISVEVASTGVQVHGGMGFIEETGAAQFLRDAQITTIYEGTTGIQANDLVGRKIARDNGAAARAALALMRDTVAALAASGGEDFAAMRTALQQALSRLEAVVEWIAATYPADPRTVLAGAVPALKLFGTVAGGWQSARAALVAQARLAAGDNEDPAFYRAKINTARFYADHVLAQASGLAHAAMEGASGVLALDDSAF